MIEEDSRQEYFQAAKNLIGESWLNNQIQSDQVEASDNTSGYELKLAQDDLPPVAVAYKQAKDDLQGDQTEIIELPELRNKSIDFLHLGKSYQSVRNNPIIDSKGNILSEYTIKELFRDRLRSTSEYQSSKYEMLVGAAYDELGHTPAFIKEDESQTKTPDIELIDLSPNVQIECKHCRKKSDNDVKQANKTNILFENISSYLPEKSHAILLELDETPTRLDVDRIGEYLIKPSEIKSNSVNTVSVPFGKVKIIPLALEEPILYPSYDTQWINLMTEFYEDIIKPAVVNYTGINKDFTDYGKSIVLFETKNNKAVLNIRRVNFIGILESTWGTDIYNRFQNQFKGVSGKFDNKPSVLHINFPDINEGDTTQEQNLRKHAGRQLIPRPDLSGVVVSGTIYHPTFSNDIATQRTIKIPNYDANHELPEEYKLIETESAIAIDERMKSAKTDIADDPDAARKAVFQKEGSLTFRFKPNEKLSGDKELYIFDFSSENKNKRVKLAATPDEQIRLERLDIEQGGWKCNIDISDIPEFDPIFVAISWTLEGVDLYIRHDSDEELRHDSCEDPVGDVIKQNGVPELQQ